jgi:uncharacterized RDD family membrane protein YckC
MEIKELSNYNFGKQKPKDDDLYTYQPSFFQKNVASIVDTIVVFVIRAIFATLVITIWYKFKIANSISFEELQGAEAFKHLLETKIIRDVIVILILTILFGGLYYAFFFSSKYHATLGCILMDVKLVHKDADRKISFLRSFARYFLYLMPILFVFIIVIQYKTRNIDISTIVLMFLIFFWYDNGIVLKGFTGMPNFLTQTNLTLNKKRKKPFSFLKSSYVKKS